MRKGQTYGTTLVDLEKQRIVNLLLDRKPETVAAWLIAHPRIEIISRDRGKEYIEGIAFGGGWKRGYQSRRSISLKYGRDDSATL